MWIVSVPFHYSTCDQDCLVVVMDVDRAFTTNIMQGASFGK